jgi:hypothetical protein
LQESNLFPPLHTLSAHPHTHQLRLDIVLILIKHGVEYRSKVAKCITIVQDESKSSSSANPWDTNGRRRASEIVRLLQRLEAIEKKSVEGRAFCKFCLSRQAPTTIVKHIHRRHLNPVSHLGLTVEQVRHYTSINVSTFVSVSVLSFLLFLFLTCSLVLVSGMDRPTHPAL